MGKRESGAKERNWLRLAATQPHFVVALEKSAAWSVCILTRSGYVGQEKGLYEPLSYSFPVIQAYQAAWLG